MRDCGKYQSRILKDNTFYDGELHVVKNALWNLRTKNIGAQMVYGPFAHNRKKIINKPETWQKTLFNPVLSLWY
jgi:hypothetical protein